MWTSGIIDTIDPFDELRKSTAGRTFVRLRNTSNQFNYINFSIHNSRIIREHANFRFKKQALGLQTAELEASIIRKLCELKTMSDDDKIDTLLDINCYQLYVDRLPLPISFFNEISSLFISEILNKRVKCINVDDNNIFNDEFDYIYGTNEMIYLLICEIFLISLKDDIFTEEKFQRFIDKTFISKLLEHLQTDDTNKRFLLKQILYQIFSKMYKFRPKILTKMQEMLLRICEGEIDSCMGISEILEIISRVIEYFSSPLLRDELLFLKHVILQLHFLPLYPLYASQLTRCLKIFIYKEENCSYLIVSKIINRWPRISSKHEEYFLKEIEEILMVSNKKDVKPLMVRLFTVFRKTLKSLNTLVLNALFDVINNDVIFEFVNAKPSVYLPIIYDRILAIEEAHWNKDIRLKASALKKRLQFLNPDQFVTIKQINVEKNAYKRFTN